MKVADLFVFLGVKGEDSAGKALKNVKGGLADVKSMSLEAKAAIVGAIYALERMMSASGKAGTDLANFGDATGLSAQKMQQWQHAARVAAVSAEEVTGSVKGVQDSMMALLQGKGAPEGFAIVANEVGIDEKRLQDTFYMMEKLQEFAQKAPANIGFDKVKSFGVSENVFSAMRRNAFNPDVMKDAPVMSDAKIKALNKLDGQWSVLGQKLKMGLSDVFARDGGKMVADISKLVDKILQLVNALGKLASKLKVFDALGKAMEGLSMLSQKIVEIKDEGDKTGASKTAGNILEGAILAWQGLKMEAEEDQKAYSDKMLGELYGKAGNKSMALPNIKGAAPATKQDININQNLNFQHEGKDHNKIKKSTKDGTQAAFRQMGAQLQVT